MVPSRALPALLAPLAGSLLFATACGSDAPSGADVFDLDPDTAGDGGDVTADATADATTDARVDPGDEDAEADTAVACEGNGDCRGGEVCRDGRCVSFCADDGDCASPATPACSARGECVPCVDDDHCDGGERCVDETCVFSCDENADCRGGELCDLPSGACYPVECAAGADCGDAAVCVDGTCIPRSTMICEPGSARCDGADRIVCAPDGRSEAGEPCPADAPCLEPAPAAAACTPLVCTPDAIGCLSATQAFLCSSDGRTQEPVDCREGQLCEDGVCFVPECDPATVSCRDGAVLTCGETGRIESIMICDDTAACRAGPAGCACAAGECVVRTCVPDTDRCIGNSAQTCDDDGMSWGVARDCGDEYCVDGECRDQVCEPSSQRCVGDVRRICSSDGRTESSIDCTSSARLCVESGGSTSCVARVCEPLSSVCDDTGLQRVVCDARGATRTTVACGAGTYCDEGACVAQVCVPGGPATCSGDDVVRCDELGRGYELVAGCGAAGCEDGACVDPCAGLDAGHLGCRFWAVDLANLDAGATGTFAISVANPGSTSVTVRAFSGASSTASRTATVSAGGAARLEMPNASVNDTGVFTAWRVESTGPILAAQYNPLTVADIFTNDASLLLPEQTLGTSYTAQSYPASLATSPGFVTIVATAPGTTTVTYRPTANVRAGGTIGATGAGVTATLALTRGQAASLASTEVAGLDLSGTSVSATQPVAVFAGVECTNVPNDTPYCDHLEEQMIPTSLWGTEFVLAQPPRRGTEPAIFRVTATQPSTLIRTSPAIAGVDGVTLAAGQTLEFATSTNATLTSTRPASVLLVQVSTEYRAAAGQCVRGIFDDGDCLIPVSGSCGSQSLGDPATGIVAPTTAFAPTTTFEAVSGWIEQFAVIVSAAGASVRLDGTELGAALATVTTTGGTRWDIRQQRLSAGVHTVSTTHARGLAVMLIGHGCGASYMLPTALRWATP